MMLSNVAARARDKVESIQVKQSIPGLLGRVGRRATSAPLRASLVATGASLGTSLVTTGAPLLTPFHPSCLCVSIRRRKHHWWYGEAQRGR